jgi:hypothetical protein
MKIEIGLLNGNTVNTQYAALALLSAHYQQNKTLEPLETVQMGMKSVSYRPLDKLRQVWLSILSGCEYISEGNTRLRPDITLAQVWNQAGFTDQSNISRTLDRLTLMNIEQLRAAVTDIWRSHSLTVSHDWRGYLWLDFDLSGLPCGKQAEASSKGYFSGKKTSRAAS